MVLRRTAYALAFAALAAATALAVNRIVQPPLTVQLLLVAGIAVAVGLPGLVHHRLAPLSLVLFPLGAYLVLRLDVPLPADSAAWHSQYAFYFGELRYGLAAYAEDVFPLTLTGVPGLRLLVVLWVYGVTALASVFALGGRRPLLGAGLLLGLAAVGLTVDQSDGDARTAALVLMLIVFLLLAAQGLSRRQWGIRETLTGLGVGGVSILLAVALLAGVPGLAAGAWQNWRTWDPFRHDRTTAVVFNWRQNYPRLLDPGNAVPVLRVTSPLPSYWKATDLEVFTGDSWISRSAFLERLTSGPGPRRVRVPAEPQPSLVRITERFTLQNISTTYLFVGGSATDVTLDLPVSVHASDTGSLRADTTLHGPLEYEVRAEVPRIRPDELVGLGKEYPAEVEDTYTALPLPPAAAVRAARAAGQDWQTQVSEAWAGGDEFLPLYDLNQSIVGNATDPYRVTLLIERYLRTRYRYTLQVPDSNRRSPLAAFLFDTRAGYCQHFAGAMALLLRLNGIPARVAVGFTTGDQVDPQTYQVSSNNAHAWVEAYFPGHGWLPFDPTPGRSLPLPGASSTTPAFVDPFPPDTPPPAPAPAPPATRSIPPEGGNFGSDRARVTRGPGNPVGVFFGLALLAGAALGRPFLRRRRRERPLRRGPLDQRLRASLALLRADVQDFGLAVPAGATLDELADILRRAAGIEAADVVGRAQAVLFGGRPATWADVRTAERVRRRSAAAHRRRQGPLWALSAWYGCPGVARWWAARGARRAAPSHWGPIPPAGSSAMRCTTEDMRGTP